MSTNIAPDKSVTGSAVSRPWWRGAVIYQIYPRSFADSDGDGIGDLAGIVDRLDYVAELGVDAIWLSPFFTSPMRDFGYDVADYCDVDPIFGALDDFDRLIAKAHQLDLKVIIDQVYSHTSDQHPWFAESRRNKTNTKSDWYVWADPKPDGSPPNNWQSVFSGAAWEWDARRQQYFLHNFLNSQPDLNLHNSDVQDALLKVAKFWLEHGVDGFRFDAINFAMHDPALRDNPPALRDGCTVKRPFDYQDHLYNQSHEDIPGFLKRIRAVTDKFGEIFTVAEVVGPNPLNEMKNFTHGDRHLDSAYNFAFLYADTLTADLVRSAIGGWTGRVGEGWPSWAFSNHDTPRAVSRWAADKGSDQTHAAKLYAMLLLSLRGNAFFYQGEELGLPQAEVSFEMLRDPEAIANWPETLGRDGARTPIPWEMKKDHAGFTTGRPWLSVDPRHAAMSLDQQQDDPDSVLNFVRKVISIRKRAGALQTGTLNFIDADSNLLAFERGQDGRKVLCVFNLTDKRVTWSPEERTSLTRIICVGMEDTISGAIPTSMPSLSGYVAEVK